MNEIEISEPSASTLDRLEAQSVHILREKKVILDYQQVPLHAGLRNLNQKGDSRHGHA